jgi:parvulin-like peptidyl-prolyl isomerase
VAHQEDEQRTDNRRRPLVFLGLGTLLGIVLAAAGLLRSGETALQVSSGDAVARVNGRVILKEDYNRVVAALAGDRRNRITPEDRKRVLDRLIDEELLIQRGLELGLADHDARIRKDLTVAMIDSIVAPTSDLRPTDAELQSFYEEIRGFLTQSNQLHLRQIWVRVPTLADSEGAHGRATEAAKRLRGGDDFAEVKSSLGDEEIAPLPEALLPATKLADYLGPTALRAVIGLEVGQVTDPVRSSTGYHVLQVVDRAAGETPRFDEVKPQVLAEYKRRAADRALRTYLDDLRVRSEVETLPIPR